MEVTLDASDLGDPSGQGAGINRWVDGVLSGGYHHYRHTDTWAPAVDIYESRSDVYVVADLAGVRAESIGIAVEGRVLTVTGKREPPRLPDGCAEVCVHVMEIDQGPFERTVPLPSDVATDRVEATFLRGFLWIKLPRRR